MKWIFPNDDHITIELNMLYLQRGKLWVSFAWCRREQGAVSGMRGSYLLAEVFCSRLRFQEHLTVLVITARSYDR